MAVVWLVVVVALGLAAHLAIRGIGPAVRSPHRRMLVTVFGAILLASVVTVLMVKGEAAAFALIG